MYITPLMSVTLTYKVTPIVWGKNTLVQEFHKYAE